MKGSRTNSVTEEVVETSSKGPDDKKLLLSSTNNQQKKNDYGLTREHKHHKKTRDEGNR